MSPLAGAISQGYFLEYKMTNKEKKMLKKDDESLEELQKAKKSFEKMKRILMTYWCILWGDTFDFLLVSAVGHP